MPAGLQHFSGHVFGSTGPCEVGKYGTPDLVMFGTSDSSEVTIGMTSLVTTQDIFTLFHLNRSFKFVSKTSNFLIPIIGWSMFLTGKPWST